MFEQYAHILKSEVPHLNIEGDTYPPPRVNEILSNVMFAVRMGLLILILAGPDALRSIGIENPPGIYMWAQDNKVQFNLRVPVNYIIKFAVLICADDCAIAGVSHWGTN